MNRFHVHLSVNNLDESIQFYQGLFGQAPEVHKEDYAKWHLQDPAVNFAISTRQGDIGLNHLGIQFENGEDLKAQEARVGEVGMKALAQEDAKCCYARSDKHWVLDPQGIPWEAFHTLESIPVFGRDRASNPSTAETKEAPPAGQSSACCVPV